VYLYTVTTRRDFLKILSAIALPLPEVELGGPVVVYLCLTRLGHEVTERVPVEFKWNSEMKMTIGEGHDVMFDGLALFGGPRESTPMRTKSFEVIHITPTCNLELSYVLRCKSPDAISYHS
jgi:hypothetical protein